MTNKYWIIIVVKLYNFEVSRLVLERLCKLRSISSNCVLIIYDSFRSDNELLTWDKVYISALYTKFGH